jgi:hypothetical protein
VARGLRIGLALAGALWASVLGGCAAPLDPLWHEELDARVTKWDVVDDELRLIAVIDAPRARDPQSQLSLTFRIDELRIAEAAIDISNGKFVHEARPDGSTAIEFKARLVQSGLATEPVLSVSAQAGLTFRAPALTAEVPARPNPKEGGAPRPPWEHPEVPGLVLTVESWDANAVSVTIQRPPGGVLDLYLLAGGKRVPTEDLRVAQLLRLAFREPCPEGAQLVAVWRAEHRCLARLEAKNIPEADE